MSSWQQVEENPTGRRSRHVLRPFSLGGSVQGLVLLQQFPVQDMTAYSLAWASLLKLFEPALSTMKRNAFVQLAPTGRAGSVAIRELGGMMDDYGLGIHPEADPPRTWNSGDFEKVTLNDKLPPLFLEIMRANSLRPGAIDAVRGRFFGTGGYAEAYTQATANFYGDATALFKPRITNRTARMFPYHAPIVRRRAAELASPADLEQWMCGSELYMRESVEDEGVLMLFRGSSTEIIERAVGTNDMPNTTLEFLV